MPAARRDGAALLRGRGEGHRGRRRRVLQQTVDAVALLQQLALARRRGGVGRGLARNVMAELVLVDARLLPIERRGAVGRIVAVGRDAAGLGGSRRGDDEGEGGRD
jgi:hypothetical protein